MSQYLVGYLPILHEDIVKINSIAGIKTSTTRYFIFYTMTKLFVKYLGVTGLKNKYIS